MPEVHQAPSGGKGGDPPAALYALRRFVESAAELRDAWSDALEGPAYPRSLPPFGRLVRDVSTWLEAIEQRPMEPSGAPFVLDFTDRASVRAWLADLRTQIDDTVGAAEDATRPPSRRALGRATARSAVFQARHAIEQILRAGERGASAIAAP
ncbi:hypothetical protein A7982_12645 [Minicystis rosea]|nr:hypothetical protein A7982_12645 [Minicystis rosea]